jgi:K+-transporting ATPase ATPase C chain
MMRRQLVSGLVVLIALTILTGIAYPLVVTGIAQTVFPNKADGSLIRVDGRVVGSRLIGQQFSLPRYFHPRPSAAGDGYDGAASGASNLGPSSPELAGAVSERASAYRAENGLPASAAVPVDAVTASGSGLDPDISPENARAQAARVARARDIPLDRVLALVERHTDGRGLGVLGEPTVNVLELNLALDGRD